MTSSAWGGQERPLEGVALEPGLVEEVGAVCSRPRMSPVTVLTLLPPHPVPLDEILHPQSTPSCLPHPRLQSRCAHSLCWAQSRPSVILPSVLNRALPRRITPMVANGLDTLKPLCPFCRKCFTATSHPALTQLIVSDHGQKVTFILNEFHFLSSRTQTQPQRPSRESSFCQTGEQRGITRDRQT